ncbi:MAG: DUF4198 domain-containing protein [Rhizobiaceae bacterium]
MRILLLVFLLAVSPAAAHEFWLAPLAYQPAADSRIEAHIVNGEKFEGIKLAYIPRKFKSFVIVHAGRAVPAKSRLGSRPALNQQALGDGLHIIAYQSEADTVNYSKFEKFQKFADHKDFPDIRARHLRRDLPEKNFREVYTRYSKALIGVGSGNGDDVRTGLETELVALDNPYTADLTDGLRVQLFYSGEVRVNAQVELFEKREGEDVSVTYYRTDVHGIATLPVQPGHDYMVDAVVLREPDTKIATESGAVWETLWANLTFSVPEK